MIAAAVSLVVVYAVLLVVAHDLAADLSWLFAGVALGLYLALHHHHWERFHD